MNPQEFDIPEADRILGYGVPSYMPKTALGKFIHDELERRQAIREEIMELIDKNPEAQNHFFKARQAQLLLTMSESSRAHAAPIPFDNTFDGDEMNIHTLPLNTTPDGIELQRIPSLYGKPAKIIITPLDRAATTIVLADPLSKDDFNKVIEMLKKIYLSEEIETISNAYISAESELYEFIFLKTSEDQVDDPDETYEELIVTNENRILNKFKEVFGIELEDSHIKLVDLIKMI